MSITSVELSEPQHKSACDKGNITTTTNTPENTDKAPNAIQPSISHDNTKTTARTQTSTKQNLINSPAKHQLVECECGSDKNKDDEASTESSCNDPLLLLVHNNNYDCNDNQNQPSAAPIIQKSALCSIEIREADAAAVIKKPRAKLKIPWFIIVISLLQIATFHSIEKETFQKLLFTSSKSNELWRYITYMFLHIDEIHLWSNILVQICIAIPLESEQNHLLVALVYIAGVLTGALGVTIFQPKIFIVGASGGIYCLLMSHIPHTIMNIGQLFLRKFRFVAVFCILLGDVVHTISHFVIKDNKEPIIGVAAHVCGAIAGVLLGFTIYMGSSSKIIRNIKYLCFIFYVCWVLFSLFIIWIK